MPRLLSFLLVLSVLSALPAAGQQTEIKYLSGTDKDHTVDWDFFVTGGRQSGKWTKIAVPSNWELKGFGTFNYGHDNPRADEKGLYKHRFQVPAAWKGRNVQIVFEGSMTDTEVKVNGRSAGPIHQGSFYQFRYDISNLLKFGRENLLEVTVSKESANKSVNEAERTADFWIFGGIYRPVYLEVRPAQHIQRLALDARADGQFAADIYLNGIGTASRVNAAIQDLDGRTILDGLSASVSPGDTLAHITGAAQGIRTWSPEFPNRYQVQVTLEQNGRAVHTITQKFGFRTMELRPRDGIYVNGVRVHMKGVDHHSFWPDAGRALSRKVSELDVQMIKDMNMNAVRMSHYPPDQHFLDVCDSLGVFVLDELTGWQDAYDTEVGSKLVRETVIRDVNHPSVVFWDNGNEGGFNYDLADDYHLYDPQKRPVIHPWENEENKINTSHYRHYTCCAARLFEGREVFMPTEFLHGLYDGGHAAGLKDSWEMMLGNPVAGGLFLWVFADEGIVRADRGGEIDTDGNHGADGIVGPYREKEGSYFAIKELWSPVYFELAEMEILPPSFDGRLRVENRFYYTNLNQVRFDWQLVRFPLPGDQKIGHTVVAQGTAAAPSVEPWNRGTLPLGLPADWRSADALYLKATDPHGREIYTWTWMLHGPDGRIQLASGTGGSAAGTESGNEYVLRAGGTEVRISKETGQLVSVLKDGKAVSFRNGPRIVEGKATLKAISAKQEGGSYVVDATYDGNLKSVQWRLNGNGWLDLAYRYENPGRHAYLGVTFDYPEAQVTGMKWLGQGPYRVWKNRMQGMTYDVWHKDYNDAITGKVWQYPEFKGNHANLYWAVIETKELPFTIVSESEDLYLRMFTPRYTEKGSNKPPEDPTYTAVAFPEGDISFLHAIAPIGTKFSKPEDGGPEGMLNESVGNSRTQNLGSYEGRLHFYFGQP